MQSHNAVAVELVENDKGARGIIATTAAAAAGGGIGIEFTSKASRTAGEDPKYPPPSFTDLKVVPPRIPFTNTRWLSRVVTDGSGKHADLL